MTAGAQCPDGIPSGFELTTTGLFWLNGGKEKIERIRICDPLEVVARTRNENGDDDHGRLLQFHTHAGRNQRWAMPMDLLSGEGREYRARLLALGLEMMAGPGARAGLTTYLHSCNPPDYVTAVSRIGWHGARFVLPDRTFGDADGAETMIYQTAAPIDHAFRTSGTLKQWRDNLAAKCVGNSRLILGVSLAFAAPLLRLLRAESGGVHLRGSSSIGKTTMLVVAGSVCGGGGPTGYIRTWRTTVNGLEAVAAAHSDSLLILDEISQATSGRDIGEAAYLLANGQGKSRARRDGSARAPVTWQLLFLSSGEMSLATKIAEDGRGHATAGQEVRVLDVIADAGAGLGLFEELHGVSDGQTFSELLKNAAATYYGTPLQEFLERLAAEPNRLTEFAKATRDQFIGAINIESYDGQVQRAAGRFGLIAAAGELATQLGKTGWEQGTAFAAAALCFYAWLLARGGKGPRELDIGIQKVRKFIEEHGTSRFATWNDDPARPTNNRVGFRRRVDAANSESPFEYFILPEAFRSEVCKGSDATALAKEMVGRGMLRPSNDGKHFARLERIPALGGEPMRIYCVTSTIFEAGENDEN